MSSTTQISFPGSASASARSFVEMIGAMRRTISAASDVTTAAWMRTLLYSSISLRSIGLVHATDGEEGARRRIAAARKVVPKFGIATECGMGRRPAEQIDGLLALHATLAKSL